MAAEESNLARIVNIEGKLKTTHDLAVIVDKDIDKLRREVRRDIADVRKDTAEFRTEVRDEIGELRSETKAGFARHDDALDELKAGQQSLEAQMRSLTQMVGQVLERLPEPPAEK